MHTRKAIIFLMENNICWWESWEFETLVHCWWESKMIRLLWEMVWHFLKRLTIELPYNPEIPLLGIYPNILKYGDRHLYTNVYSIIFHNSQKEQTAQVSISRWVHEQNVICEMEYYSTIKKNGLSLQITNTGEGMEKRKPFYTVGGNVNWCSHYEKQVPQKTKHRVAIWSSSPTPIFISEQSESEVTWSCLTLCHAMDCSLPGSSVHGILQARVLEWVAIAFSRGSSRPKDRTWVSHIPGRHFNLWVTREAQSESEVVQSYLTLCDPMDCSLPGSSLQGILQARILKKTHAPLCSQQHYLQLPRNENNLNVHQQKNG